MKIFYSSKFYLLLNSYPEFYNEIEFYKREYDYFLYGIIDKMIIDGKRIIIVDYKSDNISNKNKNEKIDAYTNQLMFYAFIAASKYPKIEQFDLNICFLRNLKYSYNKKVPRETVISFGTVIKSCVKKIRNKEFFEERNGCKNMKYYELPEN